METTYIPYVKISSGSLVTYALPTVRPHRTESQEATKANLTRGKFNGTISDKSKRELKKRAENWLLSVQEAKKAGGSSKGKDKHYITFVTLTLASKQIHSDNEIKRKLLNTFIIYVKRQFFVQEYIWRAEAQKNGNIHFHLFIDKYVHYSQLRNTWNGIQEQLGYISRFQEVHNHRNPNSTDIQRIRSAKGAGIYIAKYISKDSEYRKLEGRVWGCSDGLKKVLDFTDIADSRHWELISAIKKEPKVKTIQNEHYSVYIGDIRGVIARQFAQIDREIKLHYSDTYNALYKKIAPPVVVVNQPVKKRRNGMQCFIPFSAVATE